MVWVNSLVCIFFLTTTLAYSQNPSYYGYYASSQYRRVDEGQVDPGDADYYQSRSNDRTTNERSIPHRSEVQRLQEQERRIRPSDEMLRNGNTTFKYNNFVKNPGLPSVTNRRGTSESDSAIKFPGPTSRSKFVPEISQECEEMGFCEEVFNYPQEHVDRLIAEAGPSVSKYFSMDVLTPEITQRRGSENENKELCQYEEQINYPRAARNIEGKWFFVLNKKDIKVQGFKTEKCKKINEPCENIVFLPSIYKHECGQKLSQRLIAGLGPQGEMTLETVMTPSCCTCFIKTVSPPEDF